jgi:hypothetical protein
MIRPRDFTAEYGDSTRERLYVSPVGSPTCADQAACNRNPVNH